MSNYWGVVVKELDGATYTNMCNELALTNMLPLYPWKLPWVKFHSFKQPQQQQKYMYFVTMVIYIYIIVKIAWGNLIAHIM